MSAIPVIAIFDVGKTNKKLFLFDEQYNIVFEKSARFIETVDEDGFPCENIESLRLSVFDSLTEVFRMDKFEVKAVNFSAYGASFVYIGEDGKPVCPLYNYLKPYPEKLSAALYHTYGGKAKFSIETASPVLGSLNSGLQLYRIKKHKPEVFSEIKWALHLPHYLSFLLTGKAYTELTSIGCHTAMWNFERNQYHDWIQREDIAEKLPPIVPSDTVSPALSPGYQYKVGIGLHDSSAALIPYLVNFAEPFILISTGTWSITFNPFNEQRLSLEELRCDCLSFLQYKGKPIKASRVFSGFEYEQQVKRIAEHFKVDIIKYRNITFDPNILASLKTDAPAIVKVRKLKDSGFAMRDLHDFKDDLEAYYQLMSDLINQQVSATNLVLKGTTARRIFVDGGFSKNNVFMNMLANSYTEMEVFAASMPQSTALGAAIILHDSWNKKPLPANLIELNYYAGMTSASTK
jgi:sugar (pentulose or hexulose) kinase